MLANRVRKNFRRLQPWARREPTDCFRVYDGDIPEIPVVVDWYAGRLHVSDRSEPLPDDPTPPSQIASWTARLASAAAEALALAPTELFLKHHRRQREGSQYERTADAAVWHLVHEHGLTFRVNLSDYLDTGLFLDHRTTRGRVRHEATGRRVLNLFCYTGAFTVHAAAGGAAHTMSIDLSNTYLDWARENLALNALTGPRHTWLRADVCEWLASDQGRGQFDLIVLDPPTFSRSASMEATFDVLRDQTTLLSDTLTRLAPGGVLYFSTNHRRFRMRPESLSLGHFVELTPDSLPPDMRDRHIHRCWRITRTVNA